MRSFILTICMLLSISAYAVDTDGLKYKLTPEQREWIQNLRAPNSKIPCCDDADGVAAEWRYGNTETGYEVLAPDSVTWYPVDKGSLITPNRIGYARAWWRYDYEEEVWVLRCFLVDDGN
jgi:hypothetical protein